MFVTVVPRFPESFPNLIRVKNLFLSRESSNERHLSRGLFRFHDDGMKRLKTGKRKSEGFAKFGNCLVLSFRPKGGILRELSGKDLSLSVEMTFSVVAGTSRVKG